MINEHFYFDGYSLDTKLLSNEETIKSLANEINEKIFDNKGNITVIPYFNGKVKNDGGISVIVLGSNEHFTCHTFCYKMTVFIDYYGENNIKDIKDIILKYYNTDDYDLCINNHSIKGNFGKHIIFDNIPLLTFEEGINTIKTILKDIQMTPINEIIYLKENDTTFDLIQPIAESHISIHQKDNNCCIDVFSCKYFDEKILCKLLNCYEYKEINRGIKYK